MIRHPHPDSVSDLSHLIRRRKLDFIPDAQQCEDCGAIVELTCYTCNACGSGELRPIKLEQQRPPAGSNEPDNH